MHSIEPLLVDVDRGVPVVVAVLLRERKSILAMFGFERRQCHLARDRPPIADDVLSDGLSRYGIALLAQSVGHLGVVELVAPFLRLLLDERLHLVRHRARNAGVAALLSVPEVGAFGARIENGTSVGSQVVPEVPVQALAVVEVLLVDPPALRYRLDSLPLA